MKEVDSIFNITNAIQTKVAETEDEFIFQTLSDFAYSNYQIIVKKEELTKAIQLIRWSEVYGPSINERWITASQQSEALSDAYRRGLKDGIEKEHARILGILVKGE